MKTRIKEILKAKGMTQSDLAAKMDSTQETVSRQIGGNPTLKTIKDIAHALDVDAADLFVSSHPKGFIEYGGTLHQITSKDDLRELMASIDTKDKE